MKPRLESVFILPIIIALAFGGMAFAPRIQADALIISGGVSSTSEKPFNPLGEYENKSNQYSLRYAGQRFGVRLDHSAGGDDRGNIYVTGDVLARPFAGLVLGAGLMVARDPLREAGRRRNFHAVMGFENPHLFGDVGGGIWFDHWSNGHIHQIVGWDGVPNPPRNVISIGVIFRI